MPSENMLSGLSKDIAVENSNPDSTDVQTKDLIGPKSNDDGVIVTEQEEAGSSSVVDGDQAGERRGVSGRREWFAYIKTRQFWIVLLFGWVIKKS